MHNISKSLYTEYLKCPKLLWYDMHDFEKKVSEYAQHTLDNGTEFGILAQNYFGPCQVVTREHDLSMIDQTRAFLEQGAANIAEATFAARGGYCQADILHKNEKGNYDIVEVKSTSQIKPYHLDDIAFQYYVISSCIPVDKCFIMHLNNQYRRQGELTGELFALENVTEEVKARLVSGSEAVPAADVGKSNSAADGADNYADEDVIGAAISEIHALINGDMPDIKIHEYCDDPWECPFKETCISSLNEKERNLVSIPGLTWKQRIKCLKKGAIVLPKGKEILNMADYETLVNREGIQAFLNTVRYPLYLLDFESIQNMVPMYDGQKPWQQTPFQYSLHIMQGPDATAEELIHREFLWDSKDDPRPALVTQLISDIPADACVMAYNMSFEKSIIADLAAVYPEYASGLMAIHDSCIDLMFPFKNRSYYKGDMKASYSIKQVLPSCYPDDPELDYHNLEEVQNGSMAQEKYIELINLQPGPVKESLRRNMLKYCELDTFAMYRLLQFLYRILE